MLAIINDKLHSSFKETYEKIIRNLLVHKIKCYLANYCIEGYLGKGNVHYIVFILRI